MACCCRQAPLCNKKYEEKTTSTLRPGNAVNFFIFVIINLHILLIVK